MHGETINEHEAYTKSGFLQRIGRKEAAWRSLRRAGLRTIEIAGGAYVMGADWLEFLRTATPRDRTAATPVVESDQPAADPVAAVAVSAAEPEPAESPTAESSTALA
jgi:hypothetical protein